MNERAVARGDDLGLAEGLGRVGVETGETAAEKSGQTRLVPTDENGGQTARGT